MIDFPTPDGPRSMHVFFTSKTDVIFSSIEFLLKIKSGSISEDDGEGWDC